MNKTLDFVRETFRGKSIYRILFNWLVYKHCHNISGSVLDLASGDGASYNRYLSKEAKITFGDLNSREGKVDFNKILPFEDNVFDLVLFFNALYITSKPLFTLKEIHRVLRKGGIFYLASPFIANEMPEPHDYIRFTKEGIQRELEEVGFFDIEIERFGERFTSAAYLLNPLFFFNIFRLLANGLSIGLDKLIPKKIRERYPTPLGYFVVCRK